MIYKWMTALAISATLTATLATPATAACDSIFSAQDQVDCYQTQMDEIRAAKEEIDQAASARRLTDSFPPSDIPDEVRWMDKSREEDALRALDRALER